METNITPSLIKAVSGEFDTESVYKLSLCRMNIRKIENLHLCPNLTDLNLTGNEIVKVEGLDSCSTLRKLTLTTNNLAFLDNIGEVKTLESLFLQENKIANSSEISKLAQLSSLKTLYFRNIDGTQKNPVCDHPSYRTVIIRTLPSLTNLDGERLKHGADADMSEMPQISSLSKGPKFEIPESEPWLKDFVWDDCFADVDAFLKKSEDKFRAVVNDAKKLNANAMSLLSHYD